ncbi:MAG: HAMP domain-containing sensor histidine kinase [Solirubrobacteraceae bacterium]
MSAPPLRYLVLLAVVIVTVAVVVAAADTPAAGLVAMLMLAAVSVITLTAASIARARRRRLRLGRQFGLAAAIAIGGTLLAVGAFVLVMFLSPHDALLISLVAVFNGVLIVVAGQTAVGDVLDNVRRLRDGLAQVGEGRRDVRVDDGGSDEVAELGAAANVMIERLADEERARAGLIAAVSHDLRTPIASLRLLADALADEDIVAPHERQTYLDRMAVHIGALGALIDDLFELTRIEAGETRWAMERVQLGMLVGDTVDAMRADADAKGVVISCKIDGALAAAQANPEKLQRVLFNLVQNAIRHTPSDGSVTVLAEMADGRVHVEVADTGEGIPPAARSQVFEPFFQAGSRAARGGGGAGLGLAVSRAIIEAHGGAIWLEDAPRGTRVRFSLLAA